MLQSLDKLFPLANIEVTGNRGQLFGIIKASDVILLIITMFNNYNVLPL